ncbi:MAG: T9SS type A sorting domain-containing protein [Bacteroidota bacterium]
MKIKISFLLGLACLFFGMLSAQNGLIYGLHFSNGQLRFSEYNLQSGNLNVLTPNPISPDGYQPGVADYDHFNKVYYYLRGGGTGSQIYAIDALTGNTLSSPNLNSGGTAVSPITNIAFNWLNDTIYGLNYTYNSNTDATNLKLASVDPQSGVVQIISNSPISTTPFGSGNSDIDPVHRRYFYITTDRLYTVDLDDGTATSDVAINMPANTSFVNLTYNWVDQQLYGLAFGPAANPSGIFTYQLQLATLDPSTGNVQILSTTPLSLDGFSTSDCDIDPVGNRYFYIRQNALYTADLTTGALLSVTALPNASNAIAPLTNMAFDEFTTALPLPRAQMNMGETGSFDPANPPVLDAFVGADASYLWNDGSTEAQMQASGPGIYSIQIAKGSFVIEGSIELELSNTTAIEASLPQALSVFPNPANDYLFYQWEQTEPLIGMQLYNSQGKIVWQQNAPTAQGQISVSSLAAGIYLLKIQTAEGQRVERVVLSK